MRPILGFINIFHVLPRISALLPRINYKLIKSQQYPSSLLGIRYLKTSSALCLSKTGVPFNPNFSLTMKNQNNEVDKIKGSIAEVRAQITDVVEYMKTVQGQVDDVRTKIENTKLSLKQKKISADDRQILMLELKNYTDKDKGLMDEKAKLMDEKAKIMDKEMSLVDIEKLKLMEEMKKTSTSGAEIFDFSLNSLRLAEKINLSPKGEAVIDLSRFGLSQYFNYKCIFVRDFYDSFIEKQLGNFVWKRFHSQGAVIMGTPGIGLSAFAWYVVWKALQMGKTVIYHTNNSKDYLVFTGDKPVEVYDAIPPEYNDPNNVYVVDSVKPEITDCFVVFVTSPDRELVKDFLKWPGTARYFFPTYELDEMKLLRDSCFDGCSADNKSNILSDDELEHRYYYLFGGVPRFVLSDQTTLNSEEILDVMVSKATDQLKFGDANYATFYNLVHNIFHMVASRDISTSVETVKFSSIKAAELVIAFDEKTNAGALRNFMEFAETDPKYAALYETLFKIKLKRALLSLKSLNTKTMEGEDGIVIPLPGNDQASVRKFFDIMKIIFRN